MTVKNQKITAAGILAAAVILTAILALSGFVRDKDLAAEVAARLAADSLLRIEIRANDNLTQRKLDCALFNLPSNCRATMSPRMP